MKTLIVSYLPRGEFSRTRQLLDHARKILNTAGTEIEHLDLLTDPPDFLSAKQVDLYARRNYRGESLSDQEASLMARMDRMTDQLKKADLLVLATPMYNFSQPALVKAWFDSVLQKGKTWDIGKEGYFGLMKGKKALLLAATGGQYEGPTAFLEHLDSLTRVHFGLMGFESESVIASGLHQFPAKEAEILSDAKSRIAGVLGRWLG